MACLCRSVRWLVGAVCLTSLVACSERVPDPLVYPSADSAPPPPVAVLLRVSGDVRVAPAGTGQWVPGAADRPLRPADAVQTMEGARATVRFVGSDVTTELEPGTTLRVPEQAPRVARLRHLSGQLTARLSPRQDADRLEVALPSGQLVLDQESADDEGYAEARVTVEDDVSEVAMLRGRGRLERRRGAPVTVEQDHYVRVHTDAGTLEEGVDVAFPVGADQPAAGSEAVTRGAVVFRWPTVDGASGYDLHVRAEGGDVRDVRTETSDARVPLPPGRFTWTVRARFGNDVGHPREATAFVHRVDRTPPELTVQRPAPNERTRGRTVLVAGRTEPHARLQVNGARVPVGETGGFRAAVPVQVGLTNLVVEARDGVGNRRTLTRAVLRRQ